MGHTRSTHGRIDRYPVFELSLAQPPRPCRRGSWPRDFASLIRLRRDGGEGEPNRRTLGGPVGPLGRALRLAPPGGCASKEGRRLGSRPAASQQVAGQSSRPPLASASSRSWNRERATGSPILGNTPPPSGTYFGLRGRFLGSAPTVVPIYQSNSPGGVRLPSSRNLRRQGSSWSRTPNSWRRVRRGSASHPLPPQLETGGDDGRRGRRT